MSELPETGPIDSGTATAEERPAAQEAAAIAAKAAAAAAVSAAGAAVSAATAADAAAGAGGNAQPPALVLPTSDWEVTPPRKRELFCGSIVLALWIVTFVVGYVIPTQMLRSSIVASTQDWAQSHFSTTTPSPATATAARTDLRGLKLVGVIALVGVAFTLSNIFFLCLCASFLGCMGRRWSTPFDYKKWLKGKNDQHERPDVREVRRAYATALIRGFLVFLMILAGYLIVLPESSVNEMSPGQYARLAGAVSALSFVVGWRPESIYRLLASVFGAPHERTSHDAHFDLSQKAHAKSNGDLQESTQPHPPVAKPGAGQVEGRITGTSSGGVQHQD